MLTKNIEDMIYEHVSGVRPLSDTRPGPSQARLMLMIIPQENDLALHIVHLYILVHYGS